MRLKKDENDLLWESYISKKIIVENTSLDYLVDIFRRFSNSNNPYIDIANVLQKNNISIDDEDIETIKQAVKYLKSEEGIHLDASAIIEQLHGDDNWEHDSLYGEEDAEDDFEGDFDDGMGDDFGDDFGDGDLGMEPEAQGMVMEIDPIAPVGAHEVNEVLVSELKKLSEYSGRLYEMKDSAEFEDWMVSAITIASTYVSDVWHRLDVKADFANTGFEQSDDFQQF